MKLRYIGLKVDGERAFQKESGIEWMPGAVHEVPDAIAALMLRHPTIWESASGKPITLAAAPPARPLFSGGPVTDDDMTDEEEAKEKAAREAKAAAAQAPSDPLSGLDDAAVREFAKANGLKIQGIALTKGDNLRAKVRDAMAAVAA